MTYKDRNGNEWPNRDFYDYGSGRLLGEEVETMSAYFVDDVIGGWLVYWK